MSHQDDRPAVLPDPSNGGAGRTDEAEVLLAAVERDVILLEEFDTDDQVAVYDRAHTALADALARTADNGTADNGTAGNGTPPGPEHPGA